MKKHIAAAMLLLGLSLACAGTDSNSATPAEPQAEDVKKEIQDEDAAVISDILSKMNAASKKIKTVQAGISYLFIQDPVLLDSRTLRNGTLYFQNEDKKSNLRIHFDDIKQDDFEPEKQREEYLFDGVWLTHINYKLEQIDRYQQAPEDEPIGVFELINENFPLIGFTGSGQIEKEFDITLDKDKEPNSLPGLILSVKKDSKYKENYTKVLFRVDKDTYLPKQVIAYTPQGDESHVDFKYININKKLENTVFKLETPKHFHENVEPLNKEPSERN